MEAETDVPKGASAPETDADHWPSILWRPFIGFCFGVTFLGNYFILPFMKIPSATIPAEAWFAIGGILGVASFFRGKAQADPNVNTDPRG